MAWTLFEDDNSEDDEEVGATREEIEQWKKQEKTLKPTKQSIYILTLEEWNHSANWRRDADKTVIGVFDSKAAAVAKSATVDTGWGSFDEAIKDMFRDDYEHVDNRKNPPNNGVLLQVGGRDIGEGDYARLVISKQQVYGLPKKNDDQPKKRSASASQSTKTSNKKKKEETIDLTL